MSKRVNVSETRFNGASVQNLSQSDTLKRSLLANLVHAPRYLVIRCYDL